MVTRLNSYILTYEVKKKMRRKLIETQQTKEMGFTLCLLDNIIMPRGDFIGDLRIKIDPEACKKEEKFIGGYHTHPGGDSNPSITDLSHCGVHKIVCIGGNKDNKIKCQIWKEKQISIRDILFIAEDIKNNKIRPTNPEHKINFDCLNIMSTLGEIEDSIKKLDDELNLATFNVSLKRTAPESEKMKAGSELLSTSIIRDIYADKLVKEIKDASKKFYNEVEIKDH